jgi:HD superfamily phosphohydrolase
MSGLEGGLSKRAARRNVDMVILGAAAHDMGHGPYSHCFEHFARSHVPDWTHEDMSCKMFELAVSESDLLSQYLDDADVRNVQRVIEGKARPAATTSSPALPDAPRWLFDIVNNSRNSLDVDKMDYLVRDCYNLGPHFISSTSGTSRLIYGSRVIGDEICYKWKLRYEVHLMLQQRYNMHKMVYSHKVSKAIELMFHDVYEAAQASGVFEIAGKLGDASLFQSLNDSIIEQIEFTTHPHPSLASARALIRRVRTRDLYECVGEVVVASDKWSTIRDVTEDDIARWGDGPAAGLRGSDLILVKSRLDFPKVENQPLDSVYFFQKDSPNTPVQADRASISLLAPAVFAEYIARLYVRAPAEFGEAARGAFAAWSADRVARREVLPVPREVDTRTPASKRARGGV